jgi:hypothetical protein
MAMAYSGGFNAAKLRQSFFEKARAVDEMTELAVKAAAEMIAAEARANAPVDTHNLEEAIKVEERLTGRGNHAADVVVEGPGSRGRDISDYAMEIHERQVPAPGADLGLGPLSQAKQDADPSHQVGGLYMDRALRDKKKEAVDLIRQAARKAAL